MHRSFTHSFYGLRARILTLVAAFLLLSPLSAQANIVPWLELEDTRETTIAEPVFGGKAVVYEAGLKRKRTIVLVHGL